MRGGDSGGERTLRWLIVPLRPSNACPSADKAEPWPATKNEFPNVFHILRLCLGGNFRFIQQKQTTSSIGATALWLQAQLKPMERQKARNGRVSTNVVYHLNHSYIPTLGFSFSSLHP
jgi:hypothetical protein